MNNYLKEEIQSLKLIAELSKVKFDMTNTHKGEPFRPSALLLFSFGSLRY